SSGMIDPLSQTDTHSRPCPSTSESRSERSLLRDSPIAVTYTAGSSLTGHSCSQMPQPMHLTGSMYGRLSCIVAPHRSVTSTLRVKMALGLTGQTSSQTTQLVSIAQGRQRPWL